MDSIDERFIKAIQVGLQAEGFCFTWCQNGDLEEVARRFGADPGTGVRADPEELEELEEEHWEDLLQLTPAGEGTLAFEPHGFQGDREDIMEALSVGGHALNIWLLPSPSWSSPPSPPRSAWWSIRWWRRPDGCWSAMR
ncbi:DUF6461 domain-containing protein [Nonomuraea dietziae]